MLQKKGYIILFFLLSTFYKQSFSQQKKDSGSTKNILSYDSVSKKHSPKIASLRSALIPGWGQAYNKKYWKIPIIYGGLGVTAGIFFYNLKTYKLLKQAVIYRSDTDTSNDRLIDPRFINLSTESLRSYRNYFRQDIDYSVLAFLIWWGLNVVDATVDAHLKSFDISNDLSLRIKPGYNLANNTAGLSLVFSFKNKHPRAFNSIPYP